MSAGARSRATSMYGWPGSGTPGIGCPRQRGDEAVAQVVEVADPLGEVPAGGFEGGAVPGEHVGDRVRRVRAAVDGDVGRVDERLGPPPS